MIAETWRRLVERSSASSNDPFISGMIMAAMTAMSTTTTTISISVKARRDFKLEFSSRISPVADARILALAAIHPAFAA